MASICRLARTARCLRAIASAKTLNPRSPLSPSSTALLPPSLCHGRFEQHWQRYGSESPNTEGTQSLNVHMALAGLLGVGLVDVAFADDGGKAGVNIPPLPETAGTPLGSPPASSCPLPETAGTPLGSPPPSSYPLPETVGTPLGSPPPSSYPLPETAGTPLGSPPPSSHQNLEEIARKDKARLEELLKKKGGLTGSYPRFTVCVKGQKVTIKFQVPPSCEIPLLIANLVSRLGVMPKDRSVGSDMILQARDSGVAWQLTLSRPKTPKEASGDQLLPKDNIVNDEEFYINMFRPLISSDKAEVEFIKQGSFTFDELDALATVLQISGQPRSLTGRPREDAAQVPTIDKTISSLEGMGVKIFGLKQCNEELANADISWDNIAGYDIQKREIEDTVLLALKNPDVYDDIARGTRCKFETNRPRAVLFEGPPGTGKTSCARVIANQAGVPLLYVPLEIIMSKYYGESERLMGKVFSLAKEIPDGAIIFLDEVDAVATARDNETHEATRRLLSVLLRQIDGFEQEKKVVVIAATNRKQDLDPALLSRFDSMITFGLPDQPTREAIVAQYAKHLTKPDLVELAAITEEMSGRDIRDVCQQAERQWASKVIRGQVQNKEEQSLLPPLTEYYESAQKRRRAILDFANQFRNPNPLSKKPQFDFL